MHPLFRRDESTAHHNTALLLMDIMGQQCWPHSASSESMCTYRITFDPESQTPFTWLAHPMDRVLAHQHHMMQDLTSLNTIIILHSTSHIFSTEPVFHTLRLCSCVPQRALSISTSTTNPIPEVQTPSDASKADLLTIIDVDQPHPRRPRLLLLLRRRTTHWGLGSSRLSKPGKI